MASLARAPFQVAEAMASLEVPVPAPQLWCVKGPESWSPKCFFTLSEDLHHSRLQDDARKVCADSSNLQRKNATCKAAFLKSSRQTRLVVARTTYPAGRGTEAQSEGKMERQEVMASSPQGFMALDMS